MSDLEKLRELAEKLNDDLWYADNAAVMRPDDAKFIALCSPKTIISFLDELEAKDKSISEMNDLYKDTLSDRNSYIKELSSSREKLEIAVEALGRLDLNRRYEIDDIETGGVPCTIENIARDALRKINELVEMT